ncbi:hypothetical protein BKA69DRAFT_1047621 [Paraphysoderma sedebokerense]|nr:hypothetical protein BKA69DRAFT_1047621 [Paraphysoderma sedebokerense]
MASRYCINSLFISSSVSRQIKPHSPFLSSATASIHSSSFLSAKSSPQAAQPAKKKGKATHVGGDSRYVLIKQVLYDSSIKQVPSPSEDQVDQHTVISKAWGILRNEENLRREADMKKKYERMREAMLDLEKSYPELFEKAMEKDSVDESLYFPRLMKAPTETPATQLWNYDYTPPKSS